MAFMRSLFVVARSTTSRPTGTIIAPPSPWATRMAVSWSRLEVAAHSAEDTVNTAMAVAKVLRAPKRSATQPLTGMKIPRASR